MPDVKTDAIRARDVEDRGREEAQRPERERRDREIAARSEKQRIEQRARDEKRFDESPIADWFPGSKWKTFGCCTYIDATIYESDDVRLIVQHDGVVRWAEPHKQHITSFNCHPRHPMFDRLFRPADDWWGPVVKSAADVGREIVAYESRVAIPSGPGVRLNAEGYPV